MIIDSHVHISYLKEKKELSHVKDDLLLNMEKNKIRYSIVIPDNVPNPQCADLGTSANLVKNEPWLDMVGTLKVTKINKPSIDRIDDLFRKRFIKGFKIFPGHDPVYPTDRRWLPVYQLCIKYNLPLIIHTGINTDNRKCAVYNDPKHIVKIARTYPELKIIIAHYFWPELDYCFSITNGFHNIYFDTSGLADPEVVNASGGIERVKAILVKTIRRRVDSLIFGTDWPMCDVKKHIDLIDSLNLTQEENDQIFYKNSLDLFKLQF